MLPQNKLNKGNQACTIREALEKDAPVLIEYNNRISMETDFLTFGSGEFELSENEEIEFLRKCRMAENSIYLVASTDGELIGTLIFEGGKRSRTRHTGELSMSVSKKFQRKGVGSLLVDSLLEWAKNGKIIRKINLRVRIDNLRAFDLYLRKGFQIEGTIKREILFKDKFYDNYWMGLKI